MKRIDAPDYWMVSLDLLTPSLFEHARRLHLPAREIDGGYLVHCQLGSLFGEMAPAPFRIIQEQGRTLRVLAYSPHDDASLRRQAQIKADPLDYRSCDWTRFAAKPLPLSWPVGHRLAFDVRVCPVVRKAKDGPKHRAGAEVDVFLSACWGRDPAVPTDREKVYMGWLEQNLAAGGARLAHARMVRFHRTRVLRRGHTGSRSAHLCERPDTVMQGVLEVTNGEAFRTLVARGVGRHRAFGFGMLLLRPPEGRGC